MTAKTNAIISIANFVLMCLIVALFLKRSC